MTNTILTEQQKQEMQERVERGLKSFAKSIQNATSDLAKCGEAFNHFCECIKQDKVTAEMRYKLDKKKSEILEFTQRYSFTNSEIAPYLTDELLAQAAYFDYCPQTVCECLIPDEAFKDMYGRTVEQWRSKYLKNIRRGCYQ